MTNPPISKNLDRIQSIDFFRGISIIAVMLFHFGSMLPYGYIGVDLFFIISGFLVGGILVKMYTKGTIYYFKFILQRGFKIWPSYYFFLLFGNLIAYFIFYDLKPEYIIQWNPFSDIARYLLFYRNFTGIPNHWIFDHVWSLCIEEHFYFIFPLCLLIMLYFLKNRIRYVFAIVILMIISGFVFKYLALTFTSGQDTYSATYNRIDELAYGILIYLIIKHTEYKICNRFVIPFSLLVLGILIYLDYTHFSVFYSKVLFHSLLPIPMSILILGTYYFNFSQFRMIKELSAYSYNLYLWHPLFAIVIEVYFGINWLTVVLYFIVTFIVAYITTHYIEFPMLKLRDKLIK